MSRFKAGDIVIDKKANTESARIEVTESSTLTFKGTVIRSGYAGDNPIHPGPYKEGDWSYWFQADFALWAELQEPIREQKFKVGDLIYPHKNKYHTIAMVTSIEGNSFAGTILYTEHPTGFVGDTLQGSLTTSYTLANVEMLFKLKGNE